MEIEINEINSNNIIIDIRSKSDYLNYHYNNSINIPKNILLNNPDKYLNKSNTYYLICNKGIISKSTCNILNSLGYNCYSVKGGINAINKYY